MKPETKAGIFFVVGLIILAAFTFKVEDLGSLFRRHYDIHARVKHAAGLKVGDPVAVAGVNVGVVKEINVVGDEVDLLLRINGSQIVRSDAVGVISWSGLLGARYVDITLGTPGAPPLARGDTLKMNEALRAEEVLSKLETAATGLSDLVTDQDKETLRNLPGKLDEALTSINNLIADLREGKGTAGKLLTSDELHQKLSSVADNMNEASREVSRLTKTHSADIEKIVTDLRETSPQLKQAVSSIQSVAEKAEEGKGPLIQLLTDEKLAQDVQQTVTSMRNFADSLDTGRGVLQRLAKDEALADDLQKTVSDLRSVVSRLEQGEGSAGKLLRDETAYNDLKNLLTEARDMLRNIKEQIPVGALGSAISSAF